MHLVSYGKSDSMKKFLPVLAISFLLASCTKSRGEDEMCFQGIIKYMGAPAADGLGWVILKDDSTTTKPFIPQNLDDAYQKDRLKISVCLRETNEKFYCFCQQPLNKYRIISIRMR